MHPGPMIRGMEIQSEVADGPQSVMEEQVHNGVYVRMAILAICMGSSVNEQLANGKLALSRNLWKAESAA